MKKPEKQPRTICVYEQIHYFYPCPDHIKTEKQATEWFLNGESSNPALTEKE